MFRLVSERLAWWPVTFPGVSEEGEVVENRIELKFRLLDEDEFPSFLATLAVGAADQTDGEPESARTARRLMPVVRDWRGVGAANGEPLPFVEENFQALLRVPNVARAVGAAYVACRNAMPDIREGN